MGFRPWMGCPRGLTSVFTAGAALAPLAFALVSSAALTPEQETRKLAQHLKPISDQVWSQIAGERAAQQYSVVQQDTLYDISKRLFGDAKYWPKIWAINNGKIINPHLIFPGGQVAFLSGSGTSLPSVGVDPGETVTDAGGQKLYGADRAQEWRRLPHQSWEDVNVQLPAEIDPMGFDRSSKINFSQSTGFELQAFASDSEIPYQGEIVGARRPDYGLMLGDIAYIKSLRELQVGQTYTLTQEPMRLTGPRSRRKTYSYLNVGKIRIISVRDGLFVGTITASFLPTARGYFLVPEVERVKEPELIPGPEPLQANLLLDLRLNSRQTAQFKQVFIDRGADDGVRPGMVFRSYQHEDPATGDLITESDFIIHSDFLVVTTFENYSVAWALNGVGPTVEKAPVVLLTDITDLQRGYDEDQLPSTDQIDSELDELDRLDPGGSLGEGERRELKQLERWKEDQIQGEGEPPLPTPPEQEGEEGLPGDEPPPEEIPGEEMLEEVPPEEVPAEEIPAEEVPAEEVPSDEAPIEAVPEEAAPPTAPSPVEEAPADVTAPESEGTLPEEPPPAPEVSE